jgi:hypothetical protein
MLLKFKEGFLVTLTANHRLSVHAKHVFKIGSSWVTSLALERIHDGSERVHLANDYQAIPW